MTAFVWTDRDGQDWFLENPSRIEAEAMAIASELDRHAEILESPERALRDAARTAIRNLTPRLEQLHRDLARWNAHALAATRTQAATLVEQIDRLPTSIAGACCWSSSCTPRRSGSGQSQATRPSCASGCSASR